jgi:competence protein ComFC
MTNINPQKIHGKWRAGWALDVHTLSSRPLPGINNFDTKRTELGELVYQLKYHDAKRYNDRSKIQQIAEVVAKFVKEEFAVDGYPILPYLKAVLPIPPSDQNRNFQPVTEVAKEIGRLLSVRVPTDYLTKVKQTTPLKNLPDVASKREQLRGVFVVQSQDLKDQCVLLIDDLYDSGTTLTEVTRVLYEQGAVRHVLVLTLTRTGMGNN